MRASRENDVFLPGLLLPPNVEVTTEIAEALDGAAIVLGVMPSRHARGLYSAAAPHLRSSMAFVSATKGIENGTLLRMSEVVAEVVRKRFDPKIAVLSGPPFPPAVAGGEPAP